MNINNVTITGNRVIGTDPYHAGGVAVRSGVVNIRNSIISGNSAEGSTSPDVKGDFISNGSNLIGDTTGSTGFGAGDFTGAATLGALANNGGQTDTHLPSGTAVNNGQNCVIDLSCAVNNPPVALTADQRGAIRQLNGTVDIGAVETLSVTNTNDSGAGSLRQAIADAAAGDIITFDPAFFNTQRNIDLTSGRLTINKNLTITGPGARLLTVQRASTGNGNIFSVSVGTITISGMTISNGRNIFGGGIINSGATLTLNGVVVSGNTAPDIGIGGGIFNNSGNVTILNSTISGNTAGSLASGSGGGIYNNTGGTVNIANSTISGNVGSGNGGGIHNLGFLNMNNVTISRNSGTSSSATGGVINSGTVNIRNTIISGNTASSGSPPDVSGGFISNGSNLIGDPTGSTGFGTSGDKLNVAAMLGELTDNGGQTDTHRILAGSAAFDAGDNCVMTMSCAANNPPAALTSDQRGTGFTRQLGSAIEIGAFEGLAPTAAEVTISGRILTGDGRGVTGAFVILTDQSGMTRTVRTKAFGYYRFDNVAAGGTVILSVASKRFQYVPQVISATQNLSEINLFAAPSDSKLLKIVQPKR